MMAAAGRPPRVAVLGECNSGKSTLVNLLVGESVSPADPLPNTVRPLLVRYGPRRAEFLVGERGTMEVPPGQVAAEFALASEEGLVPPELEDVALVEMHVPAPLLRRLELLDTQGFSNPDWDAQPTREALATCDVLIWCTRAEAAWKGSEAQEWQAIPAELRQASLLLITHADALNRFSDRERVLRRIEELARGQFARIEIAALAEAQRARPAGSVLNAELWQRSGFARAEAAILDLAVRQAAARGLGVILPDEDLRGTRLAELGIGLDGLRRALLDGADLRGVYLRGADLREASLRGARLGHADLAGARLDGALLEQADLERANLAEASLQGARLAGARLEGAVLRGANLEAADLRGAHLRAADLRGARLAGADLREAELAGAFLADTDLGGAQR